MADKINSIREGVRNSAVIKNPVLFEAIGLAPAVAMAVSVKTAVMLSVISTAELIIIESIACLLLKKIKHSFRVLIYAVLGVLINIPFLMFFSKIAPNETANVSIFLPVIAVNSLIALHCERVAVKNDFRTTLIDAVSASVGYVFIIFLLGMLREVLGAGTFYSFDLKLPVKFSGLLLPFGGFLLLGFTAAIFKRLIKKKYPDEKPESAFNLSEISDKHFEALKKTAEEDYNPFDGFFSEDEPHERPKLFPDETEALPKESRRKDKKPLLALKRVRKDKPVEENKEEQPAAVNTVPAEEPHTEQKKQKRDGGFKSEFDEILADFESRRAADAASVTDEADAGEAAEEDIRKDGDGQ